jgi:DNA ligase-1
MDLHGLVETWGALRKTRSRKKKTALLASLLTECAAREVPLTVSYLTGRLPQGKIGVGYAAIEKAIADELGVGRSVVPLVEVDETFRSISEEAGAGSGARRSALLRKLFASVSEQERRFLKSLIVGELRQGASEGLMCEAIAEAAGVEVEQVRRAFMLSGDLAHVAVVAFERGSEGLDAFRAEPLVPLRPMLAQPRDDVQSAIDLLGEALFETKLDGARVQAHKKGDEIRVYSRALNDVTQSLPEVVEAVRRLPASSVILDGEAIALRQDGKPYPFQSTMRRFGRRKNVESEREAMPLSVYFFDMLYENERSLIDLPLERRRERLKALVPAALLPAHSVTDDPETAEAFWAMTLEQGHEGLMAKSLSAPYEAGSRGSHWLKVKPAHTLDLVVIAAEWGSGRRESWLSNLHLAAYDPRSDGFAMLGKTFKGLTDEMLEWQTRELLAREIHRDDHVVHVRPELVVEIAFNEVQTSPRYPNGLALRFARVKRYRPDKQPKEADQLDTVRRIHDRSAGSS